MKRKHIIILAAVAISILPACTSAMDSQSDDRVESEQSVYEYMARAYYNINRAFSIPVYSGVATGDCEGGEMLAAYCDEAQSSDSDGNAALWYKGSVSSSSMPLFTTGTGSNLWESLYSGIRISNTALYYLAKEDLEPQYDESVRAMFVSQFHALRALDYLFLIKRWGGVPIVDEPLASERDYSADSRASFAQCVDFILKDCEDALSADPSLAWFNAAPTYCPAISRGAIEAIRSQAALYAASPLWADDCQGTEKYTWAKAAEITRRSLANVLSHKGRLVGTDTTFPQESETGYGPYDKYFLSSYPWTFSWDTETLMQPYCYGNLQSSLWQTNGLPLDADQASSGACPTQEMVDAYDVVSEDGLTAVPLLVLSKPYNEDGTPNINPDATALGYRDCTASMYRNRDPRFYGTIYFDGSVAERNGAEVEIQTREGGNCALSGDPSNTRHTVTGYYLRKFINADSGADNGNKDGYLRQFRLAELYLNFAEAAYMAYGPDTPVDGMTAREAVNAVRARVGLPGINESGEEFLLRLKNERRVELAFEEHRFWDVRRWCAPDGNLSGTDSSVSGIRISADGKYERFRIERNCSDTRFLKLPIPLDEVRKAQALTGKDWQNQGW